MDRENLGEDSANLPMDYMPDRTGDSDDECARRAVSCVQCLEKRVTEALGRTEKVEWTRWS